MSLQHVAIDAKSGDLRLHERASAFDRALSTMKLTAQYSDLYTQSGAPDLARVRADSNAKHFSDKLKGAPTGMVKAILNHAAKEKVRLDGVKWDGAAPRIDAEFSQNAGYFLARQLEYRLREVLEEVLPDMMSFSMFNLLDEIPEGAEYFTQARMRAMGAAKIHRAGDSVPRVGMNQEEERFEIRQIVAAFSYNIFEGRAARYAGDAFVPKGLRVARNAIMRCMNKLTFNGSSAHKLYGLKNHPYLPKVVFSTPFTSASTGLQMYEAMQLFWDGVSIDAKNSAAPTHLALTSRIASKMKRTFIASGGKTESAWTQFITDSGLSEANIYIASELRDMGGTGVDAVLAYRKDEAGIRLVMPSGITALPEQVAGFDRDTLMFADFGGLYMPDAMNNRLGYVEVETNTVL